jgi:predicted nucleotidyltransferase component of viral defense system
VAASVRARLLDLAHERGEEFQLVLSDFATERFLYRLSISSHANQFVLKGAMLLRLWSADRYRATWDVDLLGRQIDSPDGVVAAVREICSIEGDDGLSFDAKSLVTEDIREQAEYVGVRMKLTWDLDGARIPMQVDVAIGEAVVPAPRRERYPTLLDHAAPEILAYPRETVVAEKLEAILSLGPTNSRMKDYYDLQLLAARFDFTGASIVTAIRATFEHRGTPLPDPHPEEFTRAYLLAPERRSLWQSFWKRSRPNEPPEAVEQMADTLQWFLWPVCTALAEGTTFSASWQAGGPWR